MVCLHLEPTMTRHGFRFAAITVSALCGVMSMLPARASGASRSQSIPVPYLVVDGDLHGGARVEVRWKSMGPVVEELEVMLSIDGGRHFTLRASPELEGSEDRFVWIVPNLAARDARLCLRAHLDEREVMGPPSAPFSIVRDDDQPTERWLFREDLGWDAMEHPTSRIPGFATTGGGAAFRPSTTVPPVEAPGRFMEAPLRRELFELVSESVVAPAGGLGSAVIVSRSHPRRE